MKKRLYIPVAELFILHFAVLAQQHAGQASSDSGNGLEAFPKMPASELAQKYFNHLPYRLFTIRRLIELGDPVVVPVLQGAFAEETEVTRRRFIAAALVSLADPDGKYYEYVADGMGCQAERGRKDQRQLHSIIVVERVKHELCTVPSGLAGNPEVDWTGYG